MSGEHYYTPSPQAASRPAEVLLKVGERTMVLTTDAGVFSKGHIDRGTRLLIESLQRNRINLPDKGNLCDLGCGYGPLGLVMALKRPQAMVYMVDVNERAVELARENARKNGVRNVRVELGAGMKPFAGVRFSYIMTNPPLRTGKENVHALLTEAYHALESGGALALVIRTQQGARSMERFLRTLSDTVREVDKGGGFRVYEVTHS